MTTKISGGDFAAIAICTLAWGTTWYAITWQLGNVDTIVSIFYRFAFAASLLFGWCALRGDKLALTAAAHRAAMGIGLFTFTIDYALVYLAEERVTSAVVAVMFATLAFVNLIVFRLVFRQQAPRSAWFATGLGALGVALLSWGELAHSQMDRTAMAGLALAFLGVITAAIGNVFARRAEEEEVPVTVVTAWSMGYGAVLLALYALVTQRTWSFDARWPYMLSLLHLAVIGSVVAFVLYYGLARRRGYSTASYISALTPPLAMAMSALFEGKKWGGSAFGGLALVALGQWLLLRSARPEGGYPRESPEKTQPPGLNWFTPLRILRGLFAPGQIPGGAAAKAVSGKVGAVKAPRPLESTTPPGAALSCRLNPHPRSEGRRQS